MLFCAKYSEEIMSLSMPFQNQQQGQQDRQQGRRRNQNQQREKPDGPKRDLILELSRFQDKRIRVKFTHGRQGMFGR